MDFGNIERIDLRWIEEKNASVILIRLIKSFLT